MVVGRGAAGTTTAQSRTALESSVTCIPCFSAALAHALSRLGLRSSSTSLVLYFQPVPAQLSKERHIIVCLGTPLEYKLQFLGQFLDNKKQVRKCVFLDGYFGGGRLIFRRRKLFA